MGDESQQETDNLTALETYTSEILSGLNPIPQIGFSNVKVVKGDSDQAVTIATPILVSFTDVSWDLNDEYDSSLSKFTAKETGYYLIGVGLAIFGNSVPSVALVTLVVNGVEKSNGEHLETITAGTLQKNTLLYESLTVGDVVEIRVRAITANGFSILGSLNTWLFIKRVA